MKIDNPIVSGSLIVSGSTTITGYLSASTFVGDGSGLSNMYTDSDTLSYINTLGVVSSSAQLSTEISGAFVSTSASLASNISTNDSRLTTLEGKTLISSSAQLSNQTIPGDLTVGGILTAQEFHTEFVSASIIYDSGSTKFGDTSDDIHQFTGSIQQSGSNSYFLGNIGIGTTSPSAKLDVVGDVQIDGKLDLNDGGNSVFIGTSAGLNDDASDNQSVGVGYQALYSNTTGNNNTANGVQALYSNTTGNNNTAIGPYALYSNTTGNNNTANGRTALYSNTTGIQNTANGRDALYSNTTGSYNTANGYRALHLNTTGNYNTANGLEAGRFISTGADNTVSNNSVFIGYDTRPLADAQTNQIVIGSTARGLGSNTVVLGNSSITKTRLQGDVGIGTTSPQAKLHVDGDAIIAGKVTAQEFHTEFVSASIIYDSGSTQFGNSLDDIHNFSGSLAVNTNNLFVSGGNVGIGTNNPLLDLHIETSSGEGPLIYLNTTSNLSDDDRVGSILGYINNNSVAGIQMRRESTNDDAYIQFQTQPAGGALAERMRITSTGNVGIGTTTPNEKLQVAGNVSAYVNGGIDAGLFASTSTGSTTIALRSNGVTYLNGGNVGIGTTSPSYQLHVNGSVAGVGAYVNLSDIDYKKNIYDLTDGLDKVLQLRPVTFNWKNEEYGDRINTGFIAQEVEDVLPNSVITTEDSVKSIATSELIAVLTKAVQELKEEVNELRSEIDLLKTNNQ